jgi:Xaa-Pro aminopeptidase
MLTAVGCEARRERLWKSLPAPCTCLVVADPSHLVYLAGYSPSPFVFRTVESAALLILEPGRATLVADDMLGPFVERALVDERIAPTWYDGKRAAPYRRGKLVETALRSIQRIAAGGGRVGIELATVPAAIIEGLLHDHNNTEIVDIGPLIRRLRRAKDADEIEELGRSMRAGEAAQAAALNEARPGMTELDVYLLVERAAAKALESQVIVYGDFVSGPRCELEKGGPPSSRRIEEGDLLLLDFSVVVDGYRGDFTNTFAVGGGPTHGQQKLFEACLGALRAGEESLRAGAPARTVDAAVRGHFAELGLSAFFGSHSGHGLGLGHPEPPYIVPESDETLQAGDVIALEPGLYVPGVGGMRFERNYVITEEGFDTLSNHDLRIMQST